MLSGEELRQKADQPLDPNVPQTYEIRDRQRLEQPNEQNRPKDATSAPLNEDYEPNPSASIKLEPGRQHILDAIVRLYGGSGANEEGSTGKQDMLVYAKKSIYDDIASYCDTRYKIAGQWWGVPVVMKSTTTTAIEVVSSTQADPPLTPAAIVFKMKRAWTPRLMKTFDVNHFVTLSLEKAAEEDGEGPSERVKYHKYQWNEQEYSHGGLGKVLKTMNGDMATIGTRPPKDL